MLRKMIFIVLLVMLNLGFSQVKKGSCGLNTSEEVEFNTISTSKCSTKVKKEINLITNRASKRRVIRRRIIRRKKIDVSTASSISGNKKLEEIKKTTALVSELNISDNKVVDKLPFSFVEEKPYFSSCGEIEASSKEKCFKDNLAKHIRKNYTYPPNSYEKSIQGKVYISFVIDELGEITDVKTRGPYKGDELEKEAKRIITKMPKILPGKMNGKPIKVKYNVPIIFKIPGVKPSNVRVKNKENVKFENVVNFSMVENIPLFENCKSDDSDDNKLKCFNKELSKVVKKYFYYPEDALKDNIQGRVIVYFVIDTDGDVVNIRTRGPKNGKALEDATKKIVQKFKKFKPGTDQNGEPQNVKYAFPLNFKVN